MFKNTGKKFKIIGILFFIIAILLDILIGLIVLMNMDFIFGLFIVMLTIFSSFISTLAFIVLGETHDKAVKLEEEFSRTSQEQKTAMEELKLQIEYLTRRLRNQGDASPEEFFYGAGKHRISCPGCGTENDTDSSYCRKCGRDLSDVFRFAD